MFSFNKNSIAIKISIVMFIIIVVQTMIFTGSILASDIISTLRDKSCESFSQNVKKRKRSLENEMTQNFSNINGYAYDIMTVYKEFLASNGTLDDNNVNTFLVKTSPLLVRMLRSTITTGAFIVLGNKSDTSETYSGLVLKDRDPKFNHPFDSDVYVYKGPLEVSNMLGISLSDKWGSHIRLTENEREILYNPLESSSRCDSKSSNYSECNFVKFSGYWHISPELPGKSASSASKVTYSLPLVAGHGNPFGVVGVEITQDYFYKMLPNNEIYENCSLGYILAIQNKTTGEITPVLMQESLQKSIVSLDVPLELELQDEENDVYKILNANNNSTVLCNIQKMALYEDNTLFENEQWLLIGLVEEKILYGFTNRFITTLCIAFLGSIFLGLIMAFLVGQKFVEPIVLLVKEVRKKDRQNYVLFDRTGYLEIDDLAIAIEGFSKKIFDAAVKTDKIIHMVDLPLGTFEYRKGFDVVSCSATLLRLLDIPCEKELGDTIDSSFFFKKIDEIKAKIEDEGNNIYVLSENPARWIKLISAEQEDSVLGIGMDVTKEVLDSHALKFSRDYDELTKLLNRFAFKRKSEEIFQDSVLHVSAFVLLDLDNLKYVNDVYGYDMGDIYISAAAKILSQNLEDGCLVGRLSGDEFYVFLYGFETKDTIRNHLKRVYGCFDNEQLLLPNGNQFKIRMSGGLSWYGDDSSNLEELIRFAAFAMYQGKQTIKGEIREFDKEIYMSDTFMLSGKEELNRVLDNQLIDYAFQPIVSAQTGEIYAYESLLRPQSEILNSPIKLIQIAAAQLQLSKIEKITFFKTLSLYKQYRELFGECKIFINSVPNELLTDSEYLDLEALFPDILKNVVIEIIENEKLDVVNLTRKRLLVEKWGGELALDDYGSGYNGDISLLNLAPHIVKIDRLIIEDIERDRNRQSIIQKLLLYAKERGILVLAEGVETRSQMDYLVRAGVDLLQGFYIARPMFVPNFKNDVIAKEIQLIHNTIE